MSEEINNVGQTVTPEELISTPSFLSMGRSGSDDYGIATACASAAEAGYCGFFEGQDCYGMCQETCEDDYQCGGCQGCEDACQDVCQYFDEGGDSCEDMCQDSCEFECQDSCEWDCQNTCESACQEACEDGSQGGGSGSSAKAAYIGVGGVAKKIKKQYIGVGGVAHKVKKAYIGVGGVAKLFYSLGAPGKTYSGYTIISQSGQWWLDISYYGDSFYLQCGLTHANSVWTDDEGNENYDDLLGALYYILTDETGFVTDISVDFYDMSPIFDFNWDTSELADTGKAYFHAKCNYCGNVDEHIDVEIQFI